MDSELMRNVQGEVKPRKQDAQLTGRARTIYEDIQLADFFNRGIGALAADTMEVAAQLDAQRKRLAGGDIALGTLLGRIQLEATEEMIGTIRSVRSGGRLSW